MRGAPGRHRNPFPPRPVQRFEDVLRSGREDRSYGLYAIDAFGEAVALAGSRIQQDLSSNLPLELIQGHLPTPEIGF